MDKMNVDSPAFLDNLFLPVPVPLVAELVSETTALGRRCPEILRLVEAWGRVLLGSFLCGPKPGDRFFWARSSAAGRKGNRP